MSLLTPGADDDEGDNDDEDDDRSGNKGDDGSETDDDDGYGERGLPPSPVFAGVVELVVEFDVKVSREDDDDEAEESRLVCDENMRVEVVEA